jgi:hypothetical protein
MDTEETVVPSGQHYSGTNRIPNIKQFMERLDRDKKKRDALIDDELKKSEEAGEAVDHTEIARKVGKNRRTVRDPVTGRDVEIDDIDGSFMKAVKDPKVCIIARVCVSCQSLT